jgi:hypothetical protein
VRFFLRRSILSPSPARVVDGGDEGARSPSAVGASAVDGDAARRETAHLFADFRRADLEQLARDVADELERRAASWDAPEAVDDRDVEISHHPTFSERKGALA